MPKLSDQAWVRAAVLAGALLVFANLAANMGEEYIRRRFAEMTRKAYFENVIARKGLSLKEARHWRRVENGEPREAPVIK